MLVRTVARPDSRAAKALINRHLLKLVDLVGNVAGAREGIEPSYLTREAARQGYAGQRYLE